MLFRLVCCFFSCYYKQDVSSKTIIVEDNRDLLSSKKDSEIVSGPNDVKIGLLWLKSDRNVLRMEAKTIKKRIGPKWSKSEMA